MLEHPADGQVAAPGVDPVAEQQEHLLDAEGAQREEVAVEAEVVAVPGVEGDDRPDAPLRRLDRQYDGRQRGAAKMVVGDQHRIDDVAEDLELAEELCERRLARRIDLVDQAEGQPVLPGPPERRSDRAITTRWIWFVPS